MMNEEEIHEKMDAFAASMAEHMEGVIILASNTECGETKLYRRARGNWYLQKGMAQEFLDNSKAEDQAHMIAENLSDDGEDETWKSAD